MTDSQCQRGGCTNPAVMSCTSETLFSGECVTYRCDEHRCACPSGTRAALTALGVGEG